MSTQHIVPNSTTSYNLSHISCHFVISLCLLALVTQLVPALLHLDPNWKLSGKLQGYNDRINSWTLQKISPFILMNHCDLLSRMVFHSKNHLAFLVSLIPTIPLYFLILVVRYFMSIFSTLSSLSYYHPILPTKSPNHH